MDKVIEEFKNRIQELQQRLDKLLEEQDDTRKQVDVNQDDLKVSKKEDIFVLFIFAAFDLSLNHSFGSTNLSGLGSQVKRLR